MGQRPDNLHAVVSGAKHNRYLCTGTWNAATLQYTRCQTVDLFPSLRAASAVIFHASTNSLIVTDSLKPLVLQLPLSASKERFLGCAFCDVALPSLFTAPLGGSKAVLLCMQMDGLRRVTLPELPVKAPLVDSFSTGLSPTDPSASPLGGFISSQVDRVMEVMARDKAAQAKNVKALANVGPLIDAAVQRHFQAALPQIEAAIATSVQRMQATLLAKVMPRFHLSCTALTPVAVFGAALRTDGRHPSGSSSEWLAGGGSSPAGGCMPGDLPAGERGAGERCGPVFLRSRHAASERCAGSTGRGEGFRL